MTSATEKLRKLLEERGIKWRETINHANCIFTWWEPPTFGIVHAMDNEDGETLFMACLNSCDFTPEQAIAATLGSGTCTVTRDFNCSNCGKQIGVVRNCEMYETCDGRQAWKSLDHEVCDIPNYCPNCGAKVIQGVDNAD
jgi:predicted RNA-binding Zn-ribbon protein involved in translation (DUF1610 family)